MNGFWGGRSERTFLDVRVFNPHAASNRNITIGKCYTKHEKEKKRAYEQRVREIEHACFTPLVMSASGGFTKEATIFLQNASLQIGRKVGSVIQPHHELVKVQHVLCSPTLSHSVHQRSPFTSRSCLQETASRPGKH